MTVLEIVATVVLCVLGLCTVYIWGQIVILIDKIYKKYEAEKKSVSKNETDEGK